MHVSFGLCCFEFTYKFLLLVQTHFVNIVIDVGGGGEVHLVRAMALQVFYCFLRA